MNRLKDRKSLDSLDYEIFDYSSHASTYFPENIKINDSLDPNSRWSTISNDHRQFLILKTPSSIISNITFGKFSKIHVCNVKEMKISVSFDNLNYIEVFYGGLRNDIEPETFNLKTKINGELIISRFIKIEPLAAWGMNFNYSIWYVSLWGISEVKEILREQKEKLKVKQVSNCLKNLKSLGFIEEYESLSLKLGEDKPILSKIKNLIENEDFEGVEEYVLGLETKNYENFIKENGYLAKWEEISKRSGDYNKGGSDKGGNGNNKGGSDKGGNNKNRNGNFNYKNNNWPCERGGHQMVTLNDKIYLYGGWNGLEELGDFWVYEEEEWKCILPDSYDQNINYNNNINYINLNFYPGKRSCHKMVTNNSEIYLIGRYISSITRDINPVNNDIWVYKRGWYVLPSKDKNIPPNIYDHYIAYGDGVLYCFGGKQTDDDETYGGLYRIEIKDDDEDGGDDGSSNDDHEDGGGNNNNNNEDDKGNNNDHDIISNHTLPNYNLSNTTSPITSLNTTSPTTFLNTTPPTTSLNSSGFFHKPIERWFTLREDLKQPSNTPQLRGRLGHTMIYIPKNHIPGNIYNNSLVIIGGQRGKENFKHIQFYSIDSDTIYETVQFPIKTEGRIIQRAHLYGEDLIILFTFGTEKDSKLDTFCLYSYSLIKDKWKKILKDDTLTPLPRSAHQFVKFKNHFLLFGGNVTDKSDKRQNDMWKLTLKRISIEEVKKLLSFKIRKYKVLNLLDKGWKKIAVEFLQMKVKPLVTPKNTNEFEKLCGEFFDRQDESELYEEIEKIIK